MLFPRFEILGPRNRRSDNGGVPPGYLQEGFLAIQNAVADQFLRMKSNTAFMPEILIQVGWLPVLFILPLTDCLIFLEVPLPSLC